MDNVSNSSVNDYYKQNTFSSTTNKSDQIKFNVMELSRFETVIPLFDYLCKVAYRQDEKDKKNGKINDKVAIKVYRETIRTNTSLQLMSITKGIKTLKELGLVGVKLNGKKANTYIINSEAMSVFSGKYTKKAVEKYKAKVVNRKPRTKKTITRTITRTITKKPGSITSLTDKPLNKPPSRFLLASSIYLPSTQDKVKRGYLHRYNAPFNSELRTKLDFILETKTVRSVLQYLLKIAYAIEKANTQNTKPNATQKNDGVAVISCTQRKIAKELGISHSSVFKAIQKLKKADLITTCKHKHNFYYIDLSIKEPLKKAYPDLFKRSKRSVNEKTKRLNLMQHDWDYKTPPKPVQNGNTDFAFQTLSYNYKFYSNNYTKNQVVDNLDNSKKPPPLVNNSYKHSYPTKSSFPTKASQHKLPIALKYMEYAKNRKKITIRNPMAYINTILNRFDSWDFSEMFEHNQKQERDQQKEKKTKRVEETKTQALEREQRERKENIKRYDSLSLEEKEAFRQKILASDEYKDFDRDLLEKHMKTFICDFISFSQLSNHREKQTKKAEKKRNQDLETELRERDKEIETLKQRMLAIEDIVRVSFK